jgi:catechol 2,3-dioxygenase-like lactoylglutathione lyase family enzyme
MRLIHHTGLRVADLDEAVSRWSIQFGFDVRLREERRARLACAYERYSLELQRDGGPGLGQQLPPGGSE